MLANSVTSQVTLLPLHSASVELMPSVSVASFTFCRPFAQADEHTSHRKTRIAVTAKSWEQVGTHQLYRQTQHVFYFEWPTNPCVRFHHFYRRSYWKAHQQDRYSQKWVQSQNPCRRACSPSTPTEPPCCTESRRWRRPRRTPLRRPSLPPCVSSWQSGYK